MKTKSITYVKHQGLVCSVFIAVIFLGPLKTFGQSAAISATETIEEDKKVSRPAYLNLSVGLNISKFRDFATSPLIYSGKPIYTALSHIDMDNQRESHFALSYAFGTYTSSYNQHATESKVNTISFNYIELFQFKKLCSSMLNFKFGGQLNSTFNHRKNTELFNNSEGVEIITTLFGSVKSTLDLSITQEKNKKFLFIKYKTVKRKRTLSYTMNVGVVNSSYRNGFAYTSPSAPLNDDDFFAGYELRLFDGFRLNSALDYTFFLRNKNAIQFSYLWDAHRTGGHHDNFEMSAHIFKFSLLFSLK